MEENEIMTDEVIEGTFEDEETEFESHGFNKGVIFAAGAAAAGAAIMIGRKLKPVAAKGVEKVKTKLEARKQAKAEKDSENQTAIETVENVVDNSEEK